MTCFKVALGAVITDQSSFPPGAAATMQVLFVHFKPYTTKLYINVLISNPIAQNVLPASMTTGPGTLLAELLSTEGAQISISGQVASEGRGLKACRAQVLLLPLLAHQEQGSRIENLGS